MKNSRVISHDWMLKYTPQKEWIEGKGILLWLAFFFSETGAGIYFVSLFLNFHLGWVVGWIVILVVGGLIHMAYLGKPMRSWRMFARPISSELSRGLWVTLFFAVIGFFQILPVVFPDLSWSGENPALKIVIGILCVLLITHGFMTMSVVRALPIWNSSMIVLLSLPSGIWVGSQFVELMLFLGGEKLSTVELWARWSLFSYIGILLMFFWGAFHSSDASRESVKRLMVGEMSGYFYIGVVGIGIFIPMIITLLAWRNDIHTLGGGLLFLRFISVIIGDLTMRNSLMKGASYSPLI